MTTAERNALRAGLEQIPSGRAGRWGLKELLRALEAGEELLYDGTIADAERGML